MSPKFVLHRMTAIVEKYGFNQAADGRFKREREACSTALYALGLSEMFGPKQFWVEIETVDQTPDTRVHYIDQSKGYNSVQTQSIEVVDWEQHILGPMELIQAKCRKAYPADYCLLIAARSGKMVYPQVMARDIRKMTVPFAEIWILGQSATNTVNIARLHPTILQHEFNILMALNRAQTEGDVLKRRQRGRKTEFVPLGKVYLPIP